MWDKPKAKKSRTEAFEILEKYRHSPCVICMKRPCDPCHIQSFGSGGITDDSNLLSMCRKHHQESHNKGWYKMSKKYTQIQEQLDKKGWEFVETFGVMKLRRK